MVGSVVCKGMVGAAAGAAVGAVIDGCVASVTVWTRGELSPVDNGGVVPSTELSSAPDSTGLPSLGIMSAMVCM